MTYWWVWAILMLVIFILPLKNHSKLKGGLLLILFVTALLFNFLGAREKNDTISQQSAQIEELTEKANIIQTFYATVSLKVKNKVTKPIYRKLKHFQDIQISMIFWRQPKGSKYEQPYPLYTENAYRRERQLDNFTKEILLEFKPRITQDHSYIIGEKEATLSEMKSMFISIQKLFKDENQPIPEGATAEVKVYCNGKIALDETYSINDFSNFLIVETDSLFFRYKNILEN